MPVKMVAARRHYIKSEQREVEKGDTFTVDDDREAERLIRMRRATRAAAQRVAAPAARQPKQDPVAETAAMTADSGEAAQTTARRGRYNRSDMRASEG